MTAPSPTPQYFATASRGTEDALAAEFRDHGIHPIAVARGGVAFGDRLEHAYRACLFSRIASRVLLPLTTFEATDAAAFYEGVAAVPWHEHLAPTRTLAVAVAGSGHPAGPPHFLALKAKDAIVDRIRSAVGARPDVDPRRPDLRVHVHVRERSVRVSLDLAGRGLHRRGHGRTGAEAPPRETLAAALLRLSGWCDDRGGGPLYDPMCGSGTLLVEAASIALDVAPGLARGAFGARGWLGHDTALWGRLRAEAEARRASAASNTIHVAGSDVARGAVAAARENLARAGLAARVRVDTCAIERIAPPWPTPGRVITNPPYGERLGEAGELGPLYERIGDVLRRRFAGWDGWVLTGNPALAKRIGLRPAARIRVFNGPIECRLLHYPIAPTPVSGDRGPGWRRPEGSAAPLVRRLRRNLRRLRPWAARQGLTAYRVYDTDVPEYNVAIDWYDGAVRVEAYAPPPKVAPAESERRLAEVVRSMPDVFGVAPEDVVVRVRRRRGPDEQPTRRASTGRFREVAEGDLKFRVNVHDYLDTGLFLDDRLVRARIRAAAGGRSFLNLYAHTCAATVAAAAGGARTTTSVDLSRTYLAWGRDNLAANGFTGPEHRGVRADVAKFLGHRLERDTYDLALVAPPSWSRSRGMEAPFDVQRDHGALLRAALRRLAPGGTLWFTTHHRRFELDRRLADDASVREITPEVTPIDFQRRPRLRAWVLET